MSDTIKKLDLPHPYIYGCLSGGMIAGELVAGNPLGADIGVTDMSLGGELQQFFQSEKLAIHITPNYKNTELYGALKNVFALYIGYLEGK